LNDRSVSALYLYNDEAYRSTVDSIWLCVCCNVLRSNLRFTKSQDHMAYKKLIHTYHNDHFPGKTGLDVRSDYLPPPVWKEKLWG